MEKSVSSDGNAREDPTGTSILDLNQHCLLQVFSYLDVQDAIHFGETCKSLHVVLKLALIKYKNFELIKYRDECHRRSMPSANLPPPIPLGKVLFYVAPHIQSLDVRMELTDDFTLTNRQVVRYPEFFEPESWESAAMHIFLQFDMPKLKSLIVQNSKHLAYILDRASISKLTIYVVHPDDLNIYASGLRKLTQLHLFRITAPVPVEEITTVLDNNPNIDDLCLVYENRIMYQQREFPANFLQNLPHLKNLELSIGSSEEIWRSILQVQHLSKLSLVLIGIIDEGRMLKEFLKELAKKNCVTSIEFKGVNFYHNNIGSDLLNTLASMNLSSLNLDAISITPSPQFYTALTRPARFQTLQNLQLYMVRDVREMLLIIERLVSLKRLVCRMICEECDSTALSQGISQLLNIIPTTRPDVEAEVLMLGVFVKISFCHGTYDISSSPERMRFDIPLKSYSEELFNI